MQAWVVLWGGDDQKAFVDALARVLFIISLSLSLSLSHTHTHTLHMHLFLNVSMAQYNSICMYCTRLPEWFVDIWFWVCRNECWTAFGFQDFFVCFPPARVGFYDFRGWVTKNLLLLTNNKIQERTKVHTHTHARVHEFALLVLIVLLRPFSHSKSYISSLPVTVFFNLVKKKRINQSKLKQNHKKRETYSEQKRTKDVRA